MRLWFQRQPEEPDPLQEPEVWTINVWAADDWGYYAQPVSSHGQVYGMVMEFSIFFPPMPWHRPTAEWARRAALSRFVRWQNKVAGAHVRAKDIGTTWAEPIPLLEE